MEKTIQILIKSNIERPPLLCGGSYNRIYLPEYVTLNPNQFKQVDTDNCKYFIPKNTEIARLYLFVAKEDIIYRKCGYCNNNNR